MEGGFWRVKTQRTKICLNFNWGGGVLESQNPKCQVLPKYQFSGGVWGVLESQNPKDQVLPKFQFGGVGFWRVKTESAKFCLNINFQGGGWGVLESQNPKDQVLPKFQFSEGGGVFWRVKTQRTKFCLNFNFHRGSGCSGESKPKGPSST